jgi:hypothetical protein
MKRAFVSGVAIVAACVGIAHSDPVQDTTRHFLVKYSDKSAEMYVVHYKGDLDVEHHEDGHPSEPLNGWIIDTRQCHWRIDAKITRQVCLTSKSGQEYCNGNLSIVWEIAKNNKGTDLNVWTLRPGNCGDTQARFSGDVDNARDTLMQQMPDRIDKDRSEIVAALKSLAVQPLTVSEVKPL